MNSSFIILLIMQIILLAFLVCLIYIFLINKYSFDLDKRFNDYTITSSKNIESPFFDNFFNNIWKFIKKVSNLLKRSEVLKKYSKHFEKYLNYNEIDKKTAIDYISIKFIISITLGIIYIISSIIRLNFNIMFLIFIMFLSSFLIDIYYNIDYRKRRKKIEDDLLNAIIIMNNAFKSGMNIMQAVNIVESELSGPIQDEFKKISIDIKYGLSLETVFDRFYKRVKIEDIKYISSCLSLINKTGGNIVRVFSSIEKNFYDKKKIKDEMDSLTSSSKFMFRLLVFMPVILIFVILTLNSEFFIPLISTVLGRFIILLILILYIVYILVVKKIMKVDV